MISHSKPTITDEDIKGVVKVLRSKKLSCGKMTELFEKRLGEFIKVKYSVCLNSGTSALHLSLIALGINEGDEVILPNYVCSALLNSIFYVGARPHFSDINLSDFNISFEDAKRKISKKTKAIILPHIFGSPCSLDKLLELDIPIIEDLAHSIGGEFQGKKLGSFGKLSVFSFYSTKVITTGEGGAVISNDRNLINKILDIREYDNKPTFKVRYNYKMTDFQAALGISQLKKLNFLIKKRERIAEIYDEKFKKLPLILPEKKVGRIYYRYILRAPKNRDKLLRYLNKAGVEAKVPIFKPLSYYLNLKNFPNTNIVEKEALSLPIYPDLKNYELNKVISTLRKFYEISL